MKTYFKTSKRMFKKHLAKLFSILFIILISIGLIYGVAAAPSKVNDSITEYYQDNNVADLLIKSTRQTGFSQDEITLVKDFYGEDNIMLATSFDLEVDAEVVRYHYLDLDDITINELDLLEGDMPKGDDEVLVERETGKLKKYEVGDKIEINNNTYTVAGVVKNPYYFQNLEEPSYIEDKDLTAIVYLDTNAYLPVNDIYVSFSNKNKLDNMEDSYEDIVQEEKDIIKEKLADVTVLSLYENVSFYKVFTLTDKINVIALVLLIGFICVSALVVLSTMSRLIEEERKVIACFKTLGYSNFIIMLRYLLFASIATIIGGILAYFVGQFITIVIYYNFDAMFNMPDMTDKVSYFHYFLTLGILVISTLLVTVYTSYSITKVLPAYIFKKKSPKKGKKVFLEKIPFIWKRLSFKYKSTLRNILRYKKHFFMTVISVMGSTILVFLAVGLFSYSLSDEMLGEALTFICLLVLVFAALLTILVIYTLTNINISERYKEISTLMVLGYYDKEVTGYIYREIYIMCLIGIVIGLPLGHVCLEGVFNLLDFGSMEEVGVYVYLITPILTGLFTVIITLILKRKITNIKLNESLKEVE